MFIPTQVTPFYLQLLSKNKFTSATTIVIGGKIINMICIRADIPNELSLIDDELKAIYHSTDTVCFYIFQTREKRNEFMERTQGMKKAEREELYKDYS